eukprot:CAMPEP_0194593608 /NCGR_PEP_ID=MMETSP0292-20121207/23628_1 /TAXON_ID=39354 /ORGANISM="Heterosigma akashiwo, Strain CCMP2393" /LENGTH=545 /DNA_ID=CAMNT_0039452637 /DNA_START=73 /DNA_END=1710 /DNA_ORIENTATION=+
MAELSLAFHHSTSRIHFVAISILIIFCHFAFLYGQIHNMWRLFYSVHADVVLTSDSAEADFFFGLLNITSPYSLSINSEETVEVFTYTSAINKLWKSKGLPDPLISKISAVLLMLFSGIWPHLKLLLLHVCWVMPARAAPRKRALQILRAWSFSDVFVVIFLLGVLHLDLPLSPPAVLAGLAAQLPVAVDSIANMDPAAAQTLICTQVLPFHCDVLPDSRRCQDCASALSFVLKRPDWIKELAVGALNGMEAQGDAKAALRVAGLPGIYWFCGAVVLSLLLSLAVEHVHNRLNTISYLTASYTTSSADARGMGAPLEGRNDSGVPRLPAAAGKGPGSPVRQGARTRARVRVHLALHTLSDLVRGAGADDGAERGRRAAGRAGGGGRRHLRPEVLGVDAGAGGRGRWRVGPAFAAWEVLAFAAALTWREIPGITDTLVSARRGACPAVRALLPAAAGGERACFEVDFWPRPWFALLGAALAAAWAADWLMGPWADGGDGARRRDGSTGGGTGCRGDEHCLAEPLLVVQAEASPVGTVQNTDLQQRG